MIQKFFFILRDTAAWSWNSCAAQFLNCNSKHVDRSSNWAKTQRGAQRFFLGQYNRSYLIEVYIRHDLFVKNVKSPKFQFCSWCSLITITAIASEERSEPGGIIRRPMFIVHFTAFLYRITASESDTALFSYTLTRIDEYIIMLCLFQGTVQMTCEGRLASLPTKFPWLSFPEMSGI